MSGPGSRTHRATGQALPLFAITLVALLAGAALVVDVGNVWANQRATQNATDAASLAGTTVLAQQLDGGTAPTVTRVSCPTNPADKWDLAVCEATYAAAAAENTTLSGAMYTDDTGCTTCFGGGTQYAVGGGTVPTGAQGVQALGVRSVATTFARILGINALTVNTQATAVTAVETSLCPPGVETCAILPITVPAVLSECKGNGKLTLPGGTSGSTWQIIKNSQYQADLAANPISTRQYEAIVPVCKNQNGTIGGASAGSVGWLDLTTAIGATLNPNAPGCGGNGAGNIITQISSTCITGLSFPTWIKTIPGGTGKGGTAVDTAIDAYHLQPVAIPLFDGTCDVKPGGTALADCASSGGTLNGGLGQGTWYHVPRYLNLSLDYSYLDGGNRSACGNPPGSVQFDQTNSNGSDGCFKGWFVDAFNPPPGGYQIGPITPGPNQHLTPQLIR